MSRAMALALAVSLACATWLWHARDAALQDLQTAKGEQLRLMKANAELLRERNAADKATAAWDTRQQQIFYWNGQTAMQIERAESNENVDIDAVLPADLVSPLLRMRQDGICALQGQSPGCPDSGRGSTGAVER